jgi:hypothetical protein
MSAMQKCPDDHPLMIAWNAHQQTDEFKNTLKWAKSAILISTQATAPEANRVDPEEAREQRAMGTLWAAFMAGFNAATERAASLHEQVNPASDDERHHKVPGAGAMGAVIEYRDAIRAAP